MDRKPELTGQTTQTASSDEAVEGMYQASYQQVHGIVGIVDVPEGDVLAPKSLLNQPSVDEKKVEPKSTATLAPLRQLTPSHSGLALRIVHHRNAHKKAA